MYDTRGHDILFLRFENPVNQRGPKGMEIYFVIRQQCVTRVIRKVGPKRGTQIAHVAQALI